MPFTEFQVSVSHLSPEHHYVPPPAREADEIARRRAEHAGHLIAEQQLQGIQIATEALQRVEEPEDVNFLAGVLAVSAYNTAWYSFAEGADMEVMRRHVDLPWLLGPTPHHRPTSQLVLGRAQRGLEYAAEQAYAVERAVHYGSPRVHDFRPRLGRTLASAALDLAVVDLGDKLAGSPRISDTKAQKMVRARCTRRVTQARTMASNIGSHPSLAGLSDPLSDLRVFIGRQAPTGALEAFNQAVEAAS